MAINSVAWSNITQNIHPHVFDITQRTLNSILNGFYVMSHNNMVLGTCSGTVLMGLYLRPWPLVSDCCWVCAIAGARVIGLVQIVGLVRAHLNERALVWSSAGCRSGSVLEEALILIHYMCDLSQ